MPAAILTSAADETVARLKVAGAVGHPGENGRAREEIIRGFLRAFVPRTFEIDTGFVVDATGGVSRQVDIVIYRPGYHPAVDVGGVRFFLVESVVAVLENKADIGSEAVLHAALDNIKSVKELDRSAGGTNYFMLDHFANGPQLDRSNPRHQVWGGIVAQSSLSRESFKTAMTKWISGEHRDVWPNIYVDVEGFAMYYLEPVPGGHRIALWPHGSDRFGLTNPPSGVGVAPLLDLSHAIAERLRTAGVVDYRPSNYFPSSTAVDGGVAFPTTVP